MEDGRAVDVRIREVPRPRRHGRVDDDGGIIVILAVAPVVAVAGDVLVVIDVGGVPVIVFRP